VFVGITLVLTWATSALVMGAWSSHGAPTTRLLRASLLYAAVVGWQPLLALWLVRRFVDRAFVDHSRRTISPRYTWFAIALPILLLVSATFVDVLVGASRTAADTRQLAVDGSDVVVAVAAFLGVLAVLWMQACVEELAWRGYVLPRLMEVTGPWPGLFLHGVLWGACYAPVFLVGNGDVQLLRMAGFVVTCGLLGVLLGWLRLASGSIAASATCNATLTICAGLPLVLQGVSPLFGAVFEPAGWLPMLVLVILIAVRAPWRAAVAIPRGRVPEHLN
jgi:membrane protease YdiL (CAAX protease family)